MSSSTSAGPQLGAVRIDNFKYQFYQQPQGWPGAKVTTDMPTMVNIRQDPFERTPSIGEQSLNDLGGGYMNDFYAREFWRFVSVQDVVAKLALTAIDYPPMQDPASFNLELSSSRSTRDQEQAGQLGNADGRLFGRPCSRNGRLLRLLETVRNPKTMRLACSRC